MTRPRIGLFGGTFDPPHLGHLILASEAVQQLALTRLLWVLTPQPPHKELGSITPVGHRLAMARLAIASEPRFELSTVELDRPGPHYTLDSVERVAVLEPGAEIVLLLGGDEVNDLAKWHRPRELIAACHQIGAMRRASFPIDVAQLDRQLPGLARKIIFLDVPIFEIASSDIRRRASKGQPFRYFVPEAVFDYIQANNLYAS